MSHIYIYLYKSARVLNQKRIFYYYIFKTLLNNNNLNSNPYQIRKRIYLYYYIFKTLLNNNNLNSNSYQIRKQIYIIIYLKLLKKKPLQIISLSNKKILQINYLL